MNDYFQDKHRHSGFNCITLSPELTSILGWPMEASRGGGREMMPAKKKKKKKKKKKR